VIGGRGRGSCPYGASPICSCFSTFSTYRPLHYGWSLCNGL